MASLNAVLRELETELDPDDLEQIKQLAEKFRKEGKSREEAELMAIDLVMEDVIEEYNEIVPQVNNAGGKLSLKAIEDFEDQGPDMSEEGIDAEIRDLMAVKEDVVSQIQEQSQLDG